MLRSVCNFFLGVYSRTLKMLQSTSNGSAPWGLPPSCPSLPSLAAHSGSPPNGFTRADKYLTHRY
jgi:hypothetical protein